MNIRPEGDGDHAAVGAVLRAAFGGEAVADLVGELRSSPDWAGLGFVAEVAGAVAGYVALTRALLDRRDRLVEVLVLSPLATAPEAQGRGIATALIDRAIQAAADHGAPAVFLEGDPGFYSRHGFTPAVDTRRPSLRIPAPAFQMRRIDLDASLEGTLVYSRVFWDRDSVGLRDPDLARIEAALG